MKKTTIALLFVVFLFNQTAISQPDKTTIINGTVSGKYSPKEIDLYSITNGERIQHSKATVSNNGSFEFSFSPEYSGFYLIGQVSRVRLYLSPGKHTAISITDKGYTVLNTKDKENIKMYEWNKLIRKVKGLDLEIKDPKNFVLYKEIFPILPDLVKQKDTFLAHVKTGNTSFDSLFKEMAQAEFEYEMYRLLFWTPRIYPKVEEYPAIFKNLGSEKNFTTTEVLKFDFGQLYMNIYVKYKRELKLNEGFKSDADLSSNICIENIKNDTLKGWYLLNQLLQFTAYNEAFREKSDKYRRYILSDAQKTKLNDFELSIKRLAKGEPAINFDGTTAEGKKISLSDFIGKVIMVDIWATWCGPCIAEIPSLEKLEEEMHGQDIAFISLASFDKHDAWLKFVADKKLGGVQLFADTASELILSKKYKITSIPRFMVFDKQGKIVTINAPKPSNPELRKLLDNLLSKE